MFQFSNEIIFGQLLQTFGDFLLVTLPTCHSGTRVLATMPKFVNT